MNPAPSPRNDLSEVQEAAQNALHEWNDHNLSPLTRTRVLAAF